MPGTWEVDTSCLKHPVLYKLYLVTKIQSTLLFCLHAVVTPVLFTCWLMSRIMTKLNLLTSGGIRMTNHSSISRLHSLTSYLSGWRLYIAPAKNELEHSYFPPTKSFSEKGQCYCVQRAYSMCCTAAWTKQKQEALLISF